MNKYEILIKSGSCILAVLAILGGCQYCNERLNLPDDNPFEECLEELLESQIGFELDLSPDSQEISH